MSPASYMPTEPFGPYKSIIDLMRQGDLASLEETQKESIRKDRLWDMAMPGLESLTKYYDKIMGGAWQDTPTGRAAQAQVMQNTSSLKGRVRELMASRGMSGQPMETQGLVGAEMAGGQAMNQLPLSQVPAATQFLGQTMPGATQLANPQFKNVQTGALNYLGQVLPYNLGLEGMYDKWSALLGQGQGMQGVYGNKPGGDIADLFNVGR